MPRIFTAITVPPFEPTITDKSETTTDVDATQLTQPQVTDLFDAIKRQTFVDANGVRRTDDWNYGLDGCFLRAAGGADTARRKGYVPGKEFIWSTDPQGRGNLSFSTPVAPDAPTAGQAPVPITWSYHVAERQTGTVANQLSAIVFDPATQQEAVPAWQWAAAIAGGRTPEILTVDDVRYLLSTNDGSLPYGHTYMWEAPGTQVFPTSDSGDADPSYAQEIQTEDLEDHTQDANTGDLDALAGSLRGIKANGQVSAANIEAAAAGAPLAARENFATHFPNLIADLAQALGEATGQMATIDSVAGLIAPERHE